MRIELGGMVAGLLLAGALSACSPTTVVAAGGKVPEIQVITVSGHGRAEVAPDMARISIGVEMRDSSVEAAMAEVSRRMNNLVSTLERLGVPHENIQTSSLQIMLEPPMPPPYPMAPAAPAMPPPPSPGGEVPSPAAEAVTSSMAMPSVAGTGGMYRVTSMLDVKLRDLARVGEVVSQLTAGGANQAWGISYDIEERAPVQAQARAKAVQDAKARAEQLATLGDVKLGRVLAMREGAGPEGPMPYEASYAAPMAAGAPGMVAEPGLVRVEQWVTIVYALE